MSDVSQLYKSSYAVGSEPFHGNQLDEVAARCSRAGYPQAAQTIVAFAIQHEPEQFQHWVELGMTLWYQGRRSEGMVCLEHGAKLDAGFARSYFLKEKRNENPSPIQLSEAVTEDYLNEALQHTTSAWLALPYAFQLALV
ncbi:MAG: hypothetical protein GFH27_549289n386 [Chloroflexi bacterium AL-W]|nr:hypothetical protein [Chloroflexi bacterium AL-N1]NOK67118.1 hypothetical protein [Chloroflexi bacterium AL-N10]NOK74589.1 hypothetical protein [Chloroflexi bacterium AL-N5]NOK81720.1 hypothetical protein [Chloroflexi bacterium AL-W]NOK89190.1 hypothetical protein [Chloroflexi bacterium AL-N15]